MLAQNFMSAEVLGITEEQQAALVKTLRAFETGRIPAEEFNMADWCGTARCIGGWAQTYGARFTGKTRPAGLEHLFYPGHTGGYDATLEQGAAALRNYLTTGDPQWAEVMRS